MGVAVWALIAYIASIAVWCVWLKRGIAESMVVGFVVICAFGGASFLDIGAQGLKAAFNEEIVFAALAFTFVGLLLSRSGIVDRQVAILNSLMGRLPGGAGYVATIGAAMFGSIAHAGSANAATIGAVTIPWMRRSGWPAHISATLVAGNAGLGTVIPPSASFFVLVGLATVSPHVTASGLLLTMYGVAGWCLLWRLMVVFYFVRRHGISGGDESSIRHVRDTLREGWWTVFVFVGIAIPILLTLGPLSEALSDALGKNAVKAISLMIWMPVMLALFALVLGWKHLPASSKGWYGFIAGAAPKYREIGTTMVFAFAGGASLTALGLGDQLADLLLGLEAPVLWTCAIVSVLVILVAGPLSSTATIATIGGIGFTVLTYAGVNPYLAAALILVAASTEGASPPGASAIYIATGLAEVKPNKTFIPLILYYVLPFIPIAVGIAMGWLPVPLS